MESNTCNIDLRAYRNDYFFCSIDPWVFKVYMKTVRVGLESSWGVMFEGYDFLFL
ncbi:MAG: hypothetical protein ACXAES_07560 [Promethearchaeota archaeon]